MTSGIYIRTEKIKKSLSENHANFSGGNHPMYGKHHSEETKKKISEVRKGKTYEDIFGKEKAKEIKNKISERNKGKNLSEEHKKILHEIHLGEKNKMFGKHLSKEIKQRLSINHKGLNTWVKGKHLTEDTKQKIRQARAKQIFPMRDSSIEVKIQNFLKQLGIEFIAHYYTKEISHSYQCDIFIPEQKGIPKKTIIECDGDYWHGNINKFHILNEMQLKQIEEDKIRTKELQGKGFIVIRIWENEINDLNLNEFKFKLGGELKSENF